MQKAYYTITTLIFIGIGLAACKKNDKAVVIDDTLEGNATVSLGNTINDSIYVTLSGLDIATGTSPHILEITLPPADTIIVPRTDLKDAHRYQYNWHTADYRYSNWWQTGSDKKAVELVFDYYADTTDYELTFSGEQRNELQILLDGDGQNSTWEAVDAFNGSGVSVWDTLAEAARKHSFIISRFHTAKHIFIDTNNKEDVTNLSFSIDVSQPRVWLNVSYETDSFILSNNLSGIASLKTDKQDELYYVPLSKESNGGIKYLQPYYLLSRKSVQR